MPSTVTRQHISSAPSDSEGVFLDVSARALVTQVEKGVVDLGVGTSTGGLVMIGSP